MADDDYMYDQYDDDFEEEDEWARSPSGQEAAKMLTPELRAVLGLKLNN